MGCVKVLPSSFSSIDAAQLLDHGAHHVERLRNPGGGVQRERRRGLLAGDSGEDEGRHPVGASQRSPRRG